MNWRNIGILFVILLAPILLILLIKTGDTKLGQLPILGEKVVVDGDSVDYKVDLKTHINLPDAAKGHHLILYFSENERNQISEQANEQLVHLSSRLDAARIHPKNPVTDLSIISLSTKDFTKQRTGVWHQSRFTGSLDLFIKNQLSPVLKETEQPIKDHICVLLDKDYRIRSIYFAAHGKFERDIFGELVVLQHEYSLSPKN